MAFTMIPFFQTAPVAVRCVVALEKGITRWRTRSLGTVRSSTFISKASDFEWGDGRSISLKARGVGIATLEGRKGGEERGRMGKGEEGEEGMGWD